MTRNLDELAKLVQHLIDEKVKKRREELMDKHGDIHKAMTSVDPSTFKILSENKNEDGDTVVKWEVVDYITTEFTVDNPHEIRRTGTLILKEDGSSELASW
jgi:hypothetical protein